MLFNSSLWIFWLDEIASWLKSSNRFFFFYCLECTDSIIPLNISFTESPFKADTKLNFILYFFNKTFSCSSLYDLYYQSFTWTLQDLLYYHMPLEKIFLVDSIERVWSKILSFRGSYYLHEANNTCDIKYKDRTDRIFEIARNKRPVTLLSSGIPKLKPISLTIQMNIFTYKVDSNSWLDVRFILHYL